MGCIYRIFCKDTTILDSYIGKCKNLEDRKRSHKHYANPNSRLSYLKLYQVINNNGGYDNWDIIVLEEFEWEEELSKQKERYYYDLYKPSLNIQTPNRTPDESSYAYSQTQKSKQSRHIKKVEKITCLCGMIVSRGSITEHLKRSRHLNKMDKYMENID
tara:strand:- start:7 stop:483 length:477 start_codon:yes stop_codon:yes gene_type:complete